MKSRLLQPLNLPDLSGKRVVITGATGGLGFACARSLAKAGAAIVLAVRDVARGYQAVDALFHTTLGGDFKVVELDLADQSSVRAAADQILAEPVDILVNNAGTVGTGKRQTTVDGLEVVMASNYFGHFALTARLSAALARSSTPRVVMVGSVSAGRVRLDVRNLNFERGYRPGLAYRTSKLADVMFAVELHHRAARAGWDLVAVAAHPGWSDTGIGSTGAASSVRLKLGLQQNPDEGAQAILHAATSSAVMSGGYYGPSGKFQAVGHIKRLSLPKPALDRELCTSLWRETERLTGISFPLPPTA